MPPFYRPILLIFLTLQNKPFILHVNQLSYNETEILVKKFEQITGEYPSDPAEQLFSVLESMYGSYYSISARTFRASRGCKTSGVALICQAMVMGNLTTLSSGSGTVHSRNPQTGSSSISGTFYSRSEGVADDDVVHGTRAIDIGKELNDRMPDIYMQLESCARLLERDFKDGVSLDFTIESGTIYYLNVYQCSRSPEAAIKIAVDMTGDPTLISSVLSGGDCLKPPVISRKEAVLRAPVDAMPDGLDPMWVRSEYATKLLEWSDTYRSMTVMTNCSSAGDAQASSLLKADGIGKLDMEDLIIATRNKGVMHSFSTSVTPEQRTAALHLLAGNLQEQVSEILYVAPGVSVLPAQKRTASQQENEPISNIMTQQERQHQQEKLVVVNALLYDSTTAHAFVLLPEFLECQVSAICRAVLEAQDSIGLLFEINFSLPVLISDHELDYMVPHMQHCIKDACDEYEKQCQKKLVEAEEEESKSMLSYGTGRRMVLQSNFDKGIKCNFGVCISTPRACIRAASLVSSGVVQFVVFDVEALTAATFGVKREESATFMDQYIKKHILSVNPFINLDQHGVGALIARAIEDIHRARPGVNDTTASGEKAGHVKCVAFGPQVENAASVRYLFSIGMDVISVDTKAIPMAKCAAAQASIEAQMRESGKLAGWWGDAWKALDNAMFDEGNMLIA